MQSARVLKSIQKRQWGIEDLKQVLDACETITKIRATLR